MLAPESQCRNPGIGWQISFLDERQLLGGKTGTVMLSQRYTVVILSSIALSVITLSVVFLSVIVVLNVVMLCQNEECCYSE